MAKLGLFKRPGKKEKGALYGVLEKVGMTGFAIAKSQELFRRNSSQRVFIADHLPQNADFVL